MGTSHHPTSEKRSHVAALAGLWHQVFRRRRVPNLRRSLSKEGYRGDIFR
jgi:hypothetical protein